MGHTVNRRSPIGALLATLLVTAATLVLPSAPAMAAPGTPKDDGRRIWSVRPATAHGAPDNRTHYTLQGTPGTTLTDQVRITNLSAVPVMFSIYGTDAFNTPAGVFDLLGADKKPVDVGSWVRFAHPTVTVPARKSVWSPFQIVIPPTATPGDHAGGIVVSLGPTTTPGVHVDSRVAVRLYLRIPGNLRPRLAVDPVSVHFEPGGSPFGDGSATATFTVTNPGNIRLSSHATMSISGPFGNTIATLKPVDLPEILPGQKATFTAKFPKVFPEVALTVHIELTPFPDPLQPVGQVVPGTSGSGYAWAIPWILLLIVLVVVAIVAGLWWLRRRRMFSRLDRAMAVARDETLKSAVTA
jgi:hypothetical protein